MPAQKKTIPYEVIIIGAGFAGASAALTLGRLNRSVLILDNDQPCNKSSNAIHNLLLSDGTRPVDVSIRIKQDLSAYSSIDYMEERAEDIEQDGELWTISTDSGKVFTAPRVLFCTGLRDVLPPVKGMSECWGKTVLHCPYCHGYEMKGTIGINISNIDDALNLAGLLYQLNLKIILFKDQTGSLTEEQAALIDKLDLHLIESEIISIFHNDGELFAVALSNGMQLMLKHLYINPPVEQHSNLPVMAGCGLTAQNLIRINEYYESTVPGIYAAGDCCSTIRYASLAMASGNIAGSFIHQGLCKSFYKQAITQSTT